MQTLEMTGESTLNLVSAISDNFGITIKYAPHEGIRKELKKGYKNVVFLILDGLGTSNLFSLLPKNAFLIRHFTQSLLTVYPSTTTAATVSLESGLSPIEHGWLGWTIYIPQENNKSVNLLINTDSQGKEAAPYHVGRKYMPYTPLYKKITQEGKARGHYVSPFGPGQEKTFTLMEKSIKQICHQRERQYVHGYWPQPDALMHEFGIKHFKTQLGLEKLNRRIEALAEKLKNTLLIITADHGLMEGKNINLQREDELWRMLERPPTLEPRCVNFDVIKGMEKAFAQAFRARFGADFILYTKEEALSKNLFGEGEAHLQLKSR